MLLNAYKTRKIIEAEGFVSPWDDDAVVQIAYGLRLAPAICLTWTAIGIALASPIILWALVPFAALGALLPGHPFDVIYNYGLRHLLGAPPLPRYPFGTGWGFQAGLPVVSYTIGALLAAASTLYITTGFCWLSFLLSPRSYLRHISQ
jgi:hypothetical protein